MAMPYQLFVIKDEDLMSNVFLNMNSNQFMLQLY